MPTDKINGINLYWELTGQGGEPLVLVHGSWGDHHNWASVVPDLSQTFRVLTYDRRGHSRSERPLGQGTAEQDVADLIALVEHVGLAPAHIAGNSGGAAVVLKTAAQQPSVFRTLLAHEPPLFGVLKDVPEASGPLEAVSNRIAAVTDLIQKGDNEAAAKLFVETIAFGPGGWELLPQQARETFIYNAPTFLDETLDPLNLEIDTRSLSQFDKPALLTRGTESPPFFVMVMDLLAGALPAARRMMFEGAGHVPHVSHPKQYVEMVRKFCLEHSGSQEGSVVDNMNHRDGHE